MTINLPDELLRRARRRAADEHTTVRQVVETALRQHLAGQPRNSKFKLRWRTESGRLRPGVRLDDRDALFDLMDGRP